MGVKMEAGDGGGRCVFLGRGVGAGKGVQERGIER